MAHARNATAVYFESPAAFRQWLDANHKTAADVLVGFHKVHTGRPTLTWPQSVDEASCVGWIDGVRRSVDSERYTIRFTPRRRNSNWSLVNVRRVAVLTEEGRMQPAGRRAFEARREDRTGAGSYEQPATSLDASELRRFTSSKTAWQFWQTQPPGYRKTVTHWVTSAKRAETRAKRLGTLIEDSAAGRRIGLLRRP